MEDIRNRVAVITGGGSGIGAAMAAAFTAAGASVVLADVDERGMDGIATRLRTAGGKVLTVRTDVSRLEDVQQLADRACAHFGAVHIVCNNAGVAVYGGLETVTHKDWQWLIGVNLWGVIHGVEVFAPRLIAQGQGGHIVNTASMAGLVPMQAMGVYVTTKYAVVGLTETLARDLKSYGIGVSVLCPMGVDTRINVSERNRPAALANEAASPETPVTLMGRTLAPETVAEMALAAIRHDRLYVITHDEGLEPLRRRFSRMEQAIHERKP